ncbi:glycosyltransferase family 4 protein [Paenibacillus sp. MMS20-IR301]|uniref:glycosyltransferase family 4 protein n=1 Tax=Paenibacillus sp. MMS20-IR301 TaxID=2895946 RepID=UPI0028E830E0|nr:glycosyltransferase family 4 protein [Paenibacillus sp. MMS20-IR301]WNS41776.1 glycosyltransferase family 4 protein [Paenibacillus sp. MMS20-IR301]
METLNRIRCKALAAKGIECHLLYTHNGEGRHNIRNVPTHIISSDHDIRNLLEREQFDLIVVCTDIYLAERIRKFGYRGLLVFEIQGLGVIEEARQIIEDFKERICRYADALLYPETPHLQKLLQEKITCIPHFCFDDPVDARDFGYTAYPVKDYPVIGWVGRLQVNKNWREFLQIGLQLMKHNSELYLWVFQDDTLYDPAEKVDFERFVAENNMSPRLIMYSNIPHEQMADYFSIIGDSGGLLCSTSILEGFGYAVAEAMLCRCPVLTTDSDGIRRLVIDGRTGRIYQRGQVEQAVGTALALMRKDGRREYMRRNGQEHVEMNLSPDLYANRLLGMYSSLCKGYPMK